MSEPNLKRFYVKILIEITHIRDYIKLVHHFLDLFDAFEAFPLTADAFPVDLFPRTLPADALAAPPFFSCHSRYFLNLAMVI